jgi:hypothetical protein
MSGQIENCVDGSRANILFCVFLLPERAQTNEKEERQDET